MPKAYRYNVYDNDELILENATYGEVINTLGCPSIKISSYASQGVKYQHRYSFELCGEKQRSAAIQGDLISRNAVMEMLTNIELSYTVIPITEAKLQLRDIPTAYNVKEVVRQIRDYSIEIDIPSSIGSKETRTVKVVATENATDFVRRGGKEL